MTAHMVSVKDTDCPVCDGVGRVANDDTDSLWTPMWRDCTECDGTGVLDATDEPNVLDTVNPAWGLPAGHPDFPARVADRAAREAAKGGDAA